MHTDASGSGVNASLLGAAPSGWPPGPLAKVSHGTVSVSPTPGLLQSQTPVGNVACSVANCASVMSARVVGAVQRLELALEDVVLGALAGDLGRRVVVAHDRGQVSGGELVPVGGLAAVGEVRRLVRRGPSSPAGRRASSAWIAATQRSISSTIRSAKLGLPEQRHRALPQHVARRGAGEALQPRVDHLRRVGDVRGRLVGPAALDDRRVGAACCRSPGTPSGRSCASAEGSASVRCGHVAERRLVEAADLRVDVDELLRREGARQQRLEAVLDRRRCRTGRRRSPVRPRPRTLTLWSEHAAAEPGLLRAAVRPPQPAVPLMAGQNAASKAASSPAESAVGVPLETSGHSSAPVGRPPGPKSLRNRWPEMACLPVVKRSANVHCTVMPS